MCSIQVGCAIVPLPVKAFPLVWKWYLNYGIGKRMSTDRIEGSSRWGQLVRVGLSSTSWVWILSFGSSTVLKPVGVVKDLPTRLVSPTDSLHPLSFLFIFSFSFRRARISFSFFRAASPFLLLISTISLCKDINSVICSASDILLLAMFRVDTIYFLLNTNSLSPTVGANCSRTGLGPRELLKLLFHSLGRSDCTSIPPLGSSFLSFTCSTSMSSPSSDSNGTYRRHSDA